MRPQSSVGYGVNIFESSRIRIKLRLTFLLTSKGCQHLPRQRDLKSETSLSIQYEWVRGQEPRLAQKWKTVFLQGRQFRTSCRSRLICQFWKQYVFCIATTGIIGTRCTFRSWKQVWIKFIFGFGIRVKWRTSSKETRRRNLWAMTRKMRKILWRIYHSVLRSSMKISRRQECLYPHTFLMTQIRNAVRKYASRNHSILSSLPKALKLRKSASLCRKRIGESELRAAKCADSITADHKVLNEG